MSADKPMRLWVASVTVELVVRAADETEAERVAVEMWRDEEISRSDFEVEQLRTLPDGWEIDETAPGLTHHGKTIAQCIEAGEAPEYSARLARLEARKQVQP